MTALTKLLRYTLCSNEPLFQHGQGNVWKAKDQLFDQEVALKEIRADLRNDRAAIETFCKEAAVGARLGMQSANIVKVTDFGQIDDVLYFAMEWISGGNLADHCGHISFQDAKSIIRQICNAVALAHSKGIIHSDIAPVNILFDSKSGVYKLADFGYLKIVDSSLVSRGLGSMLIGGRSYFLPPEHRLSPQKINQSTDVYAIALTFHALLTGKALMVNETGMLEIPGVIRIRHENIDCPDQIRQLLNRFVGGRQESDSIEEFRAYFSRIP